ncbi:GntR family transcriptional regulator [Listeria sp. PSOL-1]|uniref:GntR family transcriptional regulator n=1 Tax=Listeria sp. PSOL-1 TaxID=1844999 RepID=UPI0013D28E4B|nr:GntR family transcriptional regulator [Listeria sp. PSOL-1]
MPQNQTKYSYIAEEIRNRILNHQYPENQAIPSEVSLAKEFSCSRMTMKKALEVLVLEGLLYRKRGHGTFIIKSALRGEQLPIYNQEVSGFTKLLNGKNVQSEVIHFEVIFPDETVQAKLNITSETPIYDILRIRMVGDEPYVLEHTFMPVTLIPGMTQTVLENSVYRYIQEELGLRIASSYKQIRADKPSELDQKYLLCKAEDPIIEVEQTVYLNSGTAFEYSLSRHRYDKFVFKVINVVRG